MASKMLEYCKGPVINYGEGGGGTKRDRGRLQVNFYHYQKGGGGVFSHKQF